MALKEKPVAESWDVSKDGRKAVFKLQEGVRSNWGNLLSAEDVKRTWDRKFNLKGMGPFLTATLGLEKARSNQDREANGRLLQSRRAESAAAEAAGCS
ncbi:ABC transporter substrate-binding protein [Cupriavidus basilensis]